MFDFETAQIVQVEKRRSAQRQVKKPGWLGLGEKEVTETYVEKYLDWEIQRRPAQAERYCEDLGNGIRLEMVYVPPGSFLMGSPVGENDVPPDRFMTGYDGGERPQHLVVVPEFYCGRFAVTQEQYLLVMGENPSNFLGAQRPVESFFWNDAQAFCSRLAVLTGKEYGLPSEAQ